MYNIILNKLGVYLFVLLFFLTTTAFAQSLPNIQKGSVYLRDVNIDGQALEINDTFQAYNKAIDAFYTLSNNENNLYLVLKIKYEDVTSKVLLGGTTITLNHGKSKRDTAALSITFPFLEDDDRGKIANAFSESRNQKTAINAQNLVDLNALLTSVLKKLKVEGLPGQKSSIISVYNEEDIRSSARFDENLSYTYELLIPLKLLGLPNNGTETFSYQIKTNFPFQESNLKPGGPPPPPMESSSSAPTDFWGEYKLVKK